ncbi:MAG: LSM domain-containing protein [Candidatus Methanomethylicia archaeon]
MRRSTSRFSMRLRKLIGNIVEVYLVDGRVMRGTLTSIDTDYFNMILEDVVDNLDKKSKVAVVSGSAILYILIHPSSSILESMSSIERKVLEVLQRSPNLRPTDVAKLIGEDNVDEIKRVIKSLKRKGFL